MIVSSSAFIAAPVAVLDILRDTKASAIQVKMRKGSGRGLTIVYSIAACPAHLQTIGAVGKPALEVSHALWESSNMPKLQAEHKYQSALSCASLKYVELWLLCGSVC